MTRRLAIVNLSNWPNEDYAVRVDKGDGSGPVIEKIAPGQMVDLHPPFISMFEPLEIDVVQLDNEYAEKAYTPVIPGRIDTDDKGKLVIVPDERLEDE